MSLASKFRPLAHKAACGDAAIAWAAVRAKQLRWNGMLKAKLLTNNHFNHVSIRGHDNLSKQPLMLGLEIREL